MTVATIVVRAAMTTVVHAVTTAVQEAHAASALLKTTSRTTNQKCSKTFHTR
jgi:hypothetical protein